MAVARVLAGWLSFDWLDYGTGVDRSFAIGYRFLDDRNERWSLRFSRFKDGDPDPRRAAYYLMGAAVPTLLSAIGLDGRSVTFVPALASNETVASQHGALPRIAQRCASQSGGAFSNEVLTKNAHPQLHRVRTSIAQRASILNSAEYTAGAVSTPHVFVLDDLITSGATLSTIATAIKKTNPQTRVYGLALAKNQYGHSRTNDHIPPTWDRVWMRYDKE